MEKMRDDLMDFHPPLREKQRKKNGKTTVGEGKGGMRRPWSDKPDGKVSLSSLETAIFQQARRGAEEKKEW